MDQIIDLIPGLLGINVVTFYAALGVVVTISNLIGRFIPDSATGPLAVIRKVAKIIGLYAGNRITSNVSANDTARALAASIPDGTIVEAAAKLPNAVQQGVAYGNVAGALVDDLRDTIAGRKPGLPYVAGESPEPGSTVPDQYRTDGPFQQQKKLYTREGSAFKPVNLGE